MHVGPVVKAETLGFLKDGDDYLQRCRDQGDRLLREAEAQCAAIRDEAYREGYQQGHNDAQQAVLRRVMHLDGVFDAHGPLIADLVKTCLESVIGELDTKFFPAKLIEKVLAKLRKESQIVIHVAKRHTRQVRRFVADLRARHPSCSEIAVCGHDLVAGDEIVIEACNNYFRWNKERTLDAIKSCLEEVFSEHDDALTQTPQP